MSDAPETAIVKRKPPEYTKLWTGKRVHIRTQLEDLDRTDCEEDLHFFLRKAWKFIDPAPFLDGWVIDALCEHLEAVVDGDIRRLLINIPPRCCKSSLLSVAFLPWVWAQEHKSPTCGAGVPFLHASYAHTLALRDSVKRRRLIKSTWYQRLFGDRFQIVADQDQKVRFQNDKGGESLITSVESGVTGEGGNIILVDDPNNAKEILSDSVIQSTNEDWWDGTMSTRLNDARTGAIIVVQQRLGEADLSGHILENDKRGDWDHLVLPMNFERQRRAETSIGWRDPRRYEGELLWPERFGDAEVADLTARLGTWKAAGQLQQRPEPKGGGIIKRDWWKLWPPQGEVPDANGKFPPLDYPPCSFILASLDTAFTTDTMNDPTAMTIWGIFSEAADTNIPTRTIKRDLNGGTVVSVFGDENEEAITRPQSVPRAILMYSWTAYLELHKLLQKIDDSCKAFKVDRLIIENKSRGRDVSKELQRTLSDAQYSVQLIEVPSGQDKVARLYSVQHLFEEGAVFAPDHRPWAEAVIGQCGTFPNAAHDDLVDTTSQALRWLRTAGMLTRPPELQADIARNIRHVTRTRQKPLYPGVARR